MPRSGYRGDERNRSLNTHSYSCLSASIGSTLIARRAGAKQATKATPVSTTEIRARLRKLPASCGRRDALVSETSWRLRSPLRFALTLCYQCRVSRKDAKDRVDAKPIFVLNPVSVPSSDRPGSRAGLVYSTQSMRLPPASPPALHK